MNARETSAPIMPARSAEEGGRSAATSYGSVPRPATFDGFGDTGFGVTVAPDEDFRPRTPRGARSSLTAGVIGAGVLVFGLGAAVGALVSGANPLASTIAQVRRAPYPPPARYPTRPPRAPPPPRPAPAPARSTPDPTDRSPDRTRPRGRLFSFIFPAHLAAQLRLTRPAPFPPFPSPRKTRPTSVSRARPRSRRSPSVTSSRPPTATRSIHPPASRRPPTPSCSPGWATPRLRNPR